MEIKGQIEEFIYQNEANGYTIAVFSLDSDSIKKIYKDENRKALIVVRIFAFY